MTLLKFSRLALLGFLLILPLTAYADTVVVPVGGSVQSAHNAAKCGDTIILQAGVAYNANLTLNKVCTTPIVIQSSRAGELAAGVRVSPAQSALMAKLQSTVNGEPVVKTAAGAKSYRFIGIEFSTASASVVVFDLVRLGDGRGAQKTLESVPRDFVIDRSWIHGWATQEVQRGVSLNSADTTISNSYISDCHLIGNDSQAIAGWNGTSNAKIINNYLEGAGENVMFGGADAASEALTPTGIEILRNHIAKPLSWKVGDPSYAGKHWTIKNLLELKNAKNVRIIGNIFENNWTDGQAGVPIVFTVRNQECTNPFATIQNVTFTDNTVRNAQGVFNFLGKDNEAEPGYQDRPGHAKCSDAGETFGSVRGSGFVGSNNVFDKITGHALTMNGYDNVAFGRNTFIQTCTEGCNTIELYGTPSQGFVYRDSVISERAYGIHGDGGTQGKAALDKFALGWVFAGNVIGTPYDNNKIAGNEYPNPLVIGGDYRTPYAGKGADIDKLLAAQSAGSTPLPTPTPTPPAPTPSPTPIASPLPSPTPQTNDWPWPPNYDQQRALREQLRKEGWRNCQVWSGRYWCERN